MRILRVSAALAVILGVAMSTSAFAESSPVEITVTPSEELREISPYIFGVNSGVDLGTVSAKSLRLGGNRLTAYNWENNMSNAGSDWKNSNDLYLVSGAAEQFKDVPAGAMLNAVAQARERNIPYTLLTLQMAGYVSSDRGGQAKEDDAAPSGYWYKVENRKGGEFAEEPDKDDKTVYMDELLNYLTTRLGKSGVQGYSLDNEPGLWRHTHPLLQDGALSCTELIDRSTDLAAVVKEIDAEVFGPALYGYSAYVNFAGAPDWNEIKSENGYRWFIDYYLDEMRKAENANGKRLLDVLDLHYYTEAKGACGERSCSHYDNDDCVKARLDSVRSLYDPDYREKSWIVDTGAEFFPLLPNVWQSIDEYYPGTKLSFSEYNFGGGDHISGAVCEADTLGIFAEQGVYFAALWAFEGNEYQLGAINMFTDYDGNGSGFGGMLVKSEHTGGDISVYSSVDGDTVKMIVTNRSIHDDTPVSITLSSDKSYESAEVYSLYGDSPLVRQLDGVGEITDNSFTYTLPALSVTEFVIVTPAPEEPSIEASESASEIGDGVKSALPYAIGGAAAAGTAAVIATVVKKKKK
ncbi:MAG: glycoside hydrolase [Oscillospiraceae bacterium]|nr:glycoside hydrolase [Oscillospiraceae bacterium]